MNSIYEKVEYELHKELLEIVSKETYVLDELIYSYRRLRGIGVGHDETIRMLKYEQKIPISVVDD